MPYDSNGFNYQGESVLNLYNTDYKYSSSSVTSSNFKKNGTDLSTLITPACYNSNNTYSTGAKTYNGYTGFPGKNISFDSAFSASEPDTRGRVGLHSYYNSWGTNTRQLLSGHSGYITYTYTVSWGSAKYTNIIRADDAKTLYIVVVGGGGGGCSGWQNPNQSAGCGGGGAGTVVNATYTIPSSTYISFSVSGGSGGASNNAAWGTGSNGSSTTLYIHGYSTTAYGGQGGANQDVRPDNPGGSSTGAAPHSWSGDINRSWYAGSVPGSGYSNNNPSIYSISVYRNKGGDCPGYGWSGGGGGGAGGAGGPMQGAYNRYGGHGGSSVSLHGKSWGGGGGGSGDNYFNGGWGNGNHGGAEVTGSGSGGNSTVGNGSLWSWGTSSGWSGSGNIILTGSLYFG